MNAITPLHTRIAPSPSGDFHIGTARTAYFNWLAAKASGGTFTIRVDDTNKELSKVEHVSVIFETMRWLGLDHDRSFFQSKRFPLYEIKAQELVAAGKATVLDNGAVALTEIVMPDTWHDEIGGDIKVSDDDREKVKDVILLRGDGSPTYHFASVVDDSEMEINLVLRGVDHISNTARQIAIFNALGKPIPMFAHVGLIHQNKAKLSKRDGAASMLYYRGKGYDVDAMLNFLLRLGWSPKQDDKTTAIIEKDRAINMFLTEGKMQAGSSNMALDRLEAYDRKYKGRKGIWRTREKLIEG